MNQVKVAVERESQSFETERNIPSARIDRNLIADLSESFPVGRWKQVAFIEHHKPTPNRPNRINWHALRELHKVGGVYVFSMPKDFLSAPRRITLHGPNRTAIDFIFDEQSHPPVHERQIIYVGKATDLLKRFQWHFGTSPQSTLTQVRNGIFSSLGLKDVRMALPVMLNELCVIYVPLSRPENAANRDLLELTLCANFAPPFNIKSER